MHFSALWAVSLLPLIAFAAPQVSYSWVDPSVVSVINDPSTGGNAAASSTASDVTASWTATPTAIVFGTEVPTTANGAVPTAPFTNTSTTASSSAVPPADTSLANNDTFIAELLVTAKAVDRINKFPNDASFKFDFKNPPAGTVAKGKGGSTVRADREAFPALIGTGGSMTLGFLGPCGFNTPHTHPRSTEFNLVVQGTLQTQFTLENKARTIHNTLATYQMTAFPQGALHTEFNPNCEPATFVAGFASEDPGVQQIAQTFFGFDPDIVQAAVGNDFTFEGKDVGLFRSLIPENVALGVESCLKKCGLD
ncbi:MAG: hypothetical protein LQ352_000709 [Teloschistes flavicans]|nr:MAG: hypothetical protein LQ352_000709 [Teloschistes flavicans]